jgi:hypothetical protein
MLIHGSRLASGVGGGQLEAWHRPVHFVLTETSAICHDLVPVWDNSGADSAAEARKRSVQWSKTSFQLLMRRLYPRKHGRRVDASAVSWGRQRSQLPKLLDT